MTPKRIYVCSNPETRADPDVHLSLHGGTHYFHSTQVPGRWPWSEPKFHVTLVVMGNTRYIQELLGVFRSMEDGTPVCGWHYSGGAIGSLNTTLGRLRQQYAPITD